MEIHHSASLTRWKLFLGKVLPRMISGILVLLVLKFASLNTGVIMPTFMTSKLLSSVSPVSPLAKTTKKQFEVFGFAPSWTIDNMENVDFSVLTTLAYFGIPVDSTGTMQVDDVGYQTFISSKATTLFQRAHANGTRVVLTLTQMDNPSIEGLMDSPGGQAKLISDAVSLVKRRGIDGINVDFEYVGNPGDTYRNKFSSFVADLTSAMHDAVPGSRVTVSVYASAVKDPKIYDIAALGKSTDGIFMMAYDFSTSSSDQAMPTAPLYGYKQGKYWYDVSTAVSDFLTKIPSDKLILGLPWYGYNFPVVQPADKAATYYGYYTYAYNRWGYRYSVYHAAEGAHAQTYASMQQMQATQTGWDDVAKVGWKAYQDTDGIWRMVYIDDAKSLAYKYDFVKTKQLAGVGMWALGFDNGDDLWAALRSKFGTKLADSRVVSVKINDSI